MILRSMYNKMTLPATIRGLLFLTLGTFFFIALYTLTGIPQVPLLKLGDSSVSLNLSAIVTTLYLRNLSCHRYYRNYEASTLPLRQVLELHEPPCPLGNVLDFRYLINHDICGHEEVYIIILVGSHPEHLVLRNVIRKTWGNPRIAGFPIKLAFLFGKIDDPQQQRLLEEEDLNHTDILQGSFQDSYRNVTLRDLMGLRWAWRFCNQAKYIMRADDDISLDIYALIDTLESNFGDAPDFVGCFQMMVGTPVFRTGRYAVSKAEHPSDIYDPYCQGWMYMLTPHMAYNLDLAALKVTPYWMNDAYLTGTLVKALGKVPQDLKVNYTINIYEMEEAEDRLASQQPKFTVGPTGADERLTYSLHLHYRYYARINGLPRYKWTKRNRNTRHPTKNPS